MKVWGFGQRVQESRLVGTRSFKYHAACFDPGDLRCGTPGHTLGLGRCPGRVGGYYEDMTSEGAGNRKGNKHSMYPIVLAYAGSETR